MQSEGQLPFHVNEAVVEQDEGLDNRAAVSLIDASSTLEPRQPIYPFAQVSPVVIALESRPVEDLLSNAISCCLERKAWLGAVRLATQEYEEVIG